MYKWIQREQEYNVILYSEPLTEDVLRNTRPTIIISYNYSHIISKRVLSYANSINSRAINLHISMLPWNKGSNPNFWSFMENTPKGVTIHLLAPGLDSGAILYQESIIFDEKTETLRTSYDRLHALICDLFKKHWRDIIKGDYKIYEQSGNGSYHNMKMYEDFVGDEIISYDESIFHLKRRLRGE